jgi:pimeloyl-ACP methyl ester carboxylesterase
MPRVKLPDGASLFYREDDFTEPWRNAQTVVLLHGFCRNSRFWYAWVPVLALHFRVIRPDLRGCGQSSVPPAGFTWSLKQYHDDLIAFLDAAGIEAAHFVGDSMGGMVLPYIYGRNPERLRSIVTCSSNLGLKGAMAKEMTAEAPSMTAAIVAAESLEEYARKTEASRLASDEVSADAREWYAREWASTGRGVWTGWSEMIVPEIDVTADLLQNIKIPLLFLAPSRCMKLPLEEARFWATRAPHGRLETINSASQGLAFARAEECARITLRFLLEHSSGADGADGADAQSSGTAHSKHKQDKDNVVNLGTEALFAIAEGLRGMYDSDVRSRPSEKLEELMRRIERGEDLS